MWLQQRGLQLLPAELASRSGSAHWPSRLQGRVEFCHCSHCVSHSRSVEVSERALSTGDCSSLGCVAAVVVCCCWRLHSARCPVSWRICLRNHDATANCAAATASNCADCSPTEFTPRSSQWSRCSGERKNEGTDVALVTIWGGGSSEVPLAAPPTVNCQLAHAHKHGRSH